ncbi:unnamed protein product [Amoebophrya sp. A120]|nr:unnamed protein product [Amoebophrya sp. A120]|eukprot:GSA120T00003700001.1
MKRTLTGASSDGGRGLGVRQVPLSTLSLVVGQAVTYLLQQVNETSELERRLQAMGRRVGFRTFDLYCLRFGVQKRELRIVPFLQFVADKIWRSWFGHAAEVLKGENEYQLADINKNVFHSAVSTTECNLGSYVAGMVEGLLLVAGFSNQTTFVRVTAHHHYPQAQPGAALPLGPNVQRGLILGIELMPRSDG